MVEDEIYVASEGDAEAESEDQIVTDELLDDDDAGGDAVVTQQNGDDSTADVSVEENKQEPADEKSTRKRSRSMSPAATHEKDDFDDDELDSEVDETGRMHCMHSASVKMKYSVLHRDVLLCVMKGDAFCSTGLKTNKHSYLINCDFQTLQFED